jgi:hypothetical protein
VAGPLGVRLDGDDPGAGLDQRLGQCPETSADVDDPGAWREAGVRDEPGGPTRVERVPSPPRRGR